MTTAPERVIDIAARLYECRRAARQVLGDQYKENIQKWMGLLREYSSTHNVSSLNAARILATEATGHGPWTTIYLMAAAVEIEEPSPDH